MVRKGVFIMRLNDKLARDKACEMSGILFDKKPFIIKPCKVKMSLEKEDLSTIKMSAPEEMQYYKGPTPSRSYH